MYCGERLLDSKTVTRVMSLKLSEPVSPHSPKGDAFIPAHPQYRETI